MSNLRFSAASFLFVVSLAVLLLGIPSAAAAGAGSLLTLEVDRTDDFGAAAGCTVAPDDCSLRGAISLGNLQPAGTDVVIEIPAGLFELTLDGAGEDGNVTGDLDIVRDMTLRGQGREATLISGGEFMPLDDRLVEVHAPDHLVIFESLGIVHGQPVSGLHSIFVASTNLVRFEDCALSHHGNDVTGGGALRLSFGVIAAVVDCELNDNVSTGGGAAIGSNAEILALRSSRLVGNAGGSFGGALYLEDSGGGVGTVSITDSVFEGNHSRKGGAIWAGQGTDLSVTDSTFRENSAFDPTEGMPDDTAGAIYTSADLTVASSTFVGNQSTSHGAAIFAHTIAPPQGILDVFNSTFSGNGGLAGDQPAIFVENSSAEFVHVTFSGNDLDIGTDQADLVLQNSALDAGCDLVLGTFQTSGGNLAPDASCWGGAPDPSDQVVVDLELEPLADQGGPTWTHLPGPTSPVLGASPTCPEDDQRGMPRPAVDCASGAVELQVLEAAIFADGFESGDAMAWSAVVP